MEARGREDRGIVKIQNGEKVDIQGDYLHPLRGRLGWGRADLEVRLWGRRFHGE